VRPISSTTPSVSSTRTRSPSRSGCAEAIRIPATKFESVVWAANPMTRPRIAEEASRPPATARTAGITSSAERIPTKTTENMSVRRSTR